MKFIHQAKLAIVNYSVVGRESKEKHNTTVVNEGEKFTCYHSKSRGHQARVFKFSKFKWKFNKKRVEESNKMGMIKRIIKQTSHKLLNKLGAQRNSHQLVLNPPLGPNQQLAKRRKNNKRNKKQNSTAGAIPEALLLAAKNYLPPVQFHHVHGTNAQLSKNKFVARRTQSFCQALVFSNRIIMPNERVYIKVLEIAKGWSGTIRFGFTSLDPATLRYQMPKHACPDMTNAGHTWARALADEVVRANSVIHFSYNSNGYIHYGINNQDCGIFYANVNTSQHLWFIVDIYGLTAAVELIDPRIHNATGEIDFSGIDDELRADGGVSVFTHDRNTMFKSTTAMDNLISQNGPTSSSGRLKKKRARKAAQRQARALFYQQWHPLNSPIALNPHQQQGPMLPNLSSLILPTTQQNIYTPMPTTARQNRHRPAQPTTIPNEPHDYYQIMTSNNKTYSIRGPPNALVAQNLSLMSAGTSSALNSSSTCDNPVNNCSSTNSTRGSVGGTDEEEICQQLDSFQISDVNGQERQHRHLESGQLLKATKSTSEPVAAIRRRQQNNFIQTSNFKRRPIPEAALRDQTQIATTGTTLQSPSKLKTSNNATSSKLRSRHSIKAQKSSATRDSNNNSPLTRDCPICFERQINCVLYQCGHMTCCYECGVKQWRTQSRTCPICRTVIKDVIKTYMS